MAVHQGPADGGVVHTDLYQPRRQPIPPHTGPAKRPRVGRQPGVDAVRDARVYRFPHASRISATIVVVESADGSMKFAVPNRSLEA